MSTRTNQVFWAAQIPLPLRCARNCVHLSKRLRLPKSICATSPAVTAASALYHAPAELDIGCWCQRGLFFASSHQPQPTQHRQTRRRADTSSQAKAIITATTRVRLCHVSMGISRPSNAAASQTTLKLGSDRSSTSPLDASDSMDRHAHSVGLATNRGGKNTQEDAYFIGGTLPDRMTLNGYSAQNMGGCFGIFDGHGGDRASRFCAEYLFPRIAEELTHTSDVGKAMIAAVRAVDAEFCEICVSVNQAHLARAPTVFGLPSTVYQTHRMEDGSTCLIAMIRDGVLYVGNVGDSRAILSTKAGDFVSMSIDQKPDRKDERERLEARGAKVTGSPSFMYKVWPFHKFLDVPRVNGALAMSRSIGDRSLKSWIICDPEITTHQIRPEDRFLIMATDGLWDVVPSKIAARVAATTTNPQVLAEVLLKMALERKSYDNVTVLVVDVQTYMVASAGT